jgi:hypothetical protein
MRRRLCGEPGEQRRERRLVWVAPRQPLAGGDEVEFVAVWPVTVDHDQQQHSEYAYYRPYLQDGKPRSLGLLHPTIFALTANAVAQARPRVGQPGRHLANTIRRVSILEIKGPP